LSVGTSEGICFMASAFINFRMAFQDIFIMYQPEALLFRERHIYVYIY
jgi:hypothetical protein